MQGPWFPEPEATDDTYCQPEEEITSWLSRSTNERARECRRFLNANLSCLPGDHAQKIRKDLESRWESAFFELIVARTLQALGAEIAYEVPIASSGRKPDFHAAFPDVDITVEAVSPVFDGEVLAKRKSHADLSRVVEELVPEGVSAWLRSLPDLGPSDSKKEFKAAARRLLQPPFDWTEDEPFVTREEELESGLLRITLHSRSPGYPKISASPAYGGFSNSIQRILHAVGKKRDQVRGAGRPVVLAINASGMSSSFEDFDTALLGGETAFPDEEGRILYQRFICNGDLSRSKSESPAFAGILGFVEVGFRSERDPVLWIHPRFHGWLPANLLRLEYRQLGLVSAPAKSSGLLRSLRPTEPVGS
jgi:hypothetical protein